MSLMSERHMDRSVQLDDVMLAGNQLVDEGLHGVPGDPRSDEVIQRSFEEFEAMLQEVEPQHLQAYGPVVRPRMPRVAHGPVLYPKPSHLPF